MNDLMKHLTELSPEHRGLFLQTLQEEGEAFNVFPLSSAQQRFWFLHQWAPDNPAYLVPGALLLFGSLDSGALYRGLYTIIQRHEALRTIFVAVDGQPLQVIQPALPPALPILDLRGVPPATASLLVSALARQIAQQPIDLTHGPLLRMTLLRMSAGEHMLLLTLHHIVADGQSIELFLRELVALYDAFVHDRPAPLLDLPIQYADYAVWQRGSLRGAASQEQLAYWVRQLVGAPALELPTDHPRPITPNSHGARQPLMIARPLTASLTALGRRTGVTLFMTLLAAFQTLLYRYTDQADVVVGAPTSGRSVAEVERLIGCFVNTLVLRTDLSGNPPFLQLLERVRQICLEAYAHQDVPFDQVVEALHLGPDLSHPPLVQVLFTLHPAALPTLKAGDVTFEPFEVENGTAKFDLTLELVEEPEGLRGWLEYSTDLFEPSTIAALAGHLQILLHGIVAEPSRRIGELPLLTEAERYQLLVEWNHTAAGVRGQGSGVRRSLSESGCVHELFEAQAARTPDRIGLVFRPAGEAAPAHGLAHLTYDALDRRTDRLAHRLRELGVGPDMPVAIYMERSLELIVALLGVLKAGGAYLPLDPSYPAARLTFMLADSQAKVLVTQTAFDDGRWTIDDGAQSETNIVYRLSSIVRLDADWPTIARQPAHAPDVPLAPDNLAYVMYTSGSTGIPKGVAIAHAAVVNLIEAMRARLGATEQEIFLAITTLSFDIATMEIFLPLALGGRVVLADRELAADGRQIAASLVNDRVTVLQATPTTWRILLAAGWSGQPGMMLLCGGETMSVDLARRLAQRAAAVWNLYGPTETTIWSTAMCVEAGKNLLGRPLANTQIYVLNRQLQPVPIGVAGELYIGGAGLSRGYLGRPELTADRFVPNPFAKVSGIGYWVLGAEPSETQYPTPDTRLYRTGDLARYRPGGQIEYLGRLDHQVKIRGFRIEPDEIAATLRQHSAVRDVAVLAREHTSGDKRLVAYVVPANDARCPEGAQTNDEGSDSSFRVPSGRRNSSLASELRDFVAQRLPDYMIPAHFVLLERLPLMVSGKLDLRALPAPDWSAQAVPSAFVAPRTALEQQLAAIWAGVLGLEQVGIHDNFFQLGGHSLLATQLMSRVQATFQVELPLRVLFAAPTIAEFAAELMRSKGTTPAALERAPREGSAPLSFAQQRLWFLDSLLPGNPVYTIPAAALLSGPLSIAALQQSFREIIRRHETLRTTFAVSGGQPAQVIAPSETAQITLLPLIDLRALPAAVREDAARRLIAAIAREPFDLAAGPLLRVRVVRLAADAHFLALTLHHIIADGWSIKVLLHEIAAHYRAARGGTQALLPELPIQYADYTIWQRQWLQGEVLERQVTYWLRSLAGAPPMLELPTDYPRPAIPSAQGAHHHVLLPAPLQAALQALSRQEGVTLFMTLLAAFQVLLTRYSDQTDIVVGTPIANRTHAETEPLIGLFVNTLVLRTNLAGALTVRDLLRRVREVCLAAYAHQDLPFEQLVEELQPTRDLSRHPLFQVLFAQQNAPLPTVALPELTICPLEVESGTAKFDLALSTMESAQGVVEQWEYRTDLFEAATIARMSAHFATLLEGIAADPTQRIAYLPLLSASERAQLLVEWSHTALAYRHEQCVHELFAVQVAQTPEAVALAAHDGQLTYQVLDAQANQLAHFLRSRGVGPEVRVGVCLERSLALVIALLGIWKAGGAYVPLDPAYPAERIAFMLEDSGATVVLTKDERRTTNDQISQLVSLSACQLVHLDADWPTIAHQPTHSPANGVAPANLAYLIYTSGTTGTPKAVMVEHRQLADILLTLQTTLELRASDVLPAIASCAFDIFLFQLWGALLAGGRIVLLAPPQVLDLAQFTHILQQVTILEAVPSLLRQVVAHIQAHPAAGIYRALRLVMPGGDLIPPDLLHDLAQVFPQATLYPTYGPTESTIMATSYRVPYGEWGARPLLGRPLANRTIQILDAQQQPLPIGVVGELYIGGSGVSRGYWQRPDLTAERFVPNPFGTMNDEDRTMNEPDSSFIVHRSSFSSRLYKTGDLARYRADGMIEFLGRADAQVKLRGFRIELGEIEAVLGRHPDIAAAAVLAREDRPGEKRLTAYIVLGSGVRGQGSGVPDLPIGDEGRTTNDESSDSSFVVRRSSFVAELRTFLAAHLPDYMVPTAFVPLSTMPLTPNGKLDRRALPAPDLRSSGQLEAYVAPRTSVEDLLAKSWQQVLGVDRVGVNDNFFALGGHSLLVTQAIARIRDLFQIELPLRSLFESPTIAELAERITTAEHSRGVVSPIRPIPRGGPLPLSFAQQRLWFLDQLEPDSPAYTLLAPVRASGLLDIVALERSVADVVARHETLRTTFTVAGEQPAQVIAPAGTAVLELVDLRSLPHAVRADEMDRFIQAEALRPFDLTRGPLLRTMLVWLEDDQYLLLVVMHHIISDGWSIGVLVHELATSYSAHIAGQPATLPDLPIQYADYAVWQREWLQGALLEAQLSYWRAALAGAVRILELPTDRPRPPIQTQRGARYPAILPAALADSLASLSQHEGVTLFMLLLAAFQALLYRYTGQEDILVGSPIANRRHTSIEPLIGFFVNTLVLRGDLSGNPRFRDLLGRTRDMTLGAYAHQDLPFERLVEELQPERDLSHSPLFQVLFVLQNAPAPALELAELTLQLLDADNGTAKFDLTLVIDERLSELHLVAEYNTDLFDTPTIARMLGHLRALLEAVALDPGRRLADLPLLPEAERRQVLLEWNETAAWYPAESCLADLFEAQVERTPDAVALVQATNDVRCPEGAQTNGAEPSSIVHRPSSIVHLTYRELNARANQLAHHLRTLGIGPDVPVGICTDRSLAMVSGVLGILKAGGAYVPLDPSYPAERLTFMLADSGARILITTKDEGRRTNGQIDHLVTLSPCHLVNLKADWPAIARQPATNPDSGAIPDNLAYVIYTSGSTGRPKGVSLPHRVLVNLITWHLKALSGGVRTLQFASLSFDVSFHEIFSTCCSGGTLVIVPEELRPDIGGLARFLRDQRVQKLTFPIVVLQEVAEQCATRPDLLDGLQDVIATGEQLQITPAVIELFDRLPGCTLHNHYGPSETHLVTTLTLPRPASDWPSHPSIGRPIANTQIYVLDRYLNPAPFGVVGELYIGGICLARGYLNRPDLTAERFIPNPCAPTNDERRTTNDERRTTDKLASHLVTLSPCHLVTMAGSRLYKTGDLARYLPNGNIEFLGRIDHQVKLRGFRVELDEIESVLIGHPAVREAVVTARETGPGGKWLVAYIVQGSGVKGQGSGNGSPQFTVGTQQSNDNWIRSESSSIVHRLSSANDQSDRSSFRVPSGRRNSSLASELRSFLREHLPDYMVPAAFVLLPALPLNPNGKVDRKALPEPERAEADGAFVAPRTPNEEIMAGIWSAVLRLERISIADHFFELGGHSLLATQLVSRVRDVFRVELPLRTLFETPTVSGLTERVEQIRRAAVDLSMPPLQPVPRDSDIPLSFAQQRLWFFDQWAPGTIAYTLPVAVRLTGQLDVAVLRRSLGQIVRRHESLRTTFAICNGYPVQVIKPSLALDLPLLDLQALPARARAAASQRICEAESLRPFDLARGPLLRAGLVRVDAAEHIFLLTLHHIVADGWSIAVFIEEFRALYDALCAGRSAALPELPIQYADFAVWQRAWLQGDVLERQLAYWRRHLDGAEVLELPTDRPRPAVQSLRGAHVAQMLPPSLSQALHTLSRGASVTLFMTLLAAFLVLLQRYSDQDDIVVGAPIANRTLSEIERLIGFFVNTLALRADLAGNPPFQELLRHIRQVCLAAYAHQDLPFEKLVEGLELERDVSRNPLFQVMFMLQNVPMSVFELTNLVLRPLDIDRAIATFDITLAMDDTTEGLLAVWEYNTDLFDAATIARMVGHFQTLLHEVVSAPERPIADLPLLAAVERSQILVGWNVTRAISPAAHCFHQLYAAQAARIPDSIAVAYGDMQITYQELERRANQLAHLLRRSGVTSDVCVGVCVERSLELIVGLLAILKAGGAYVPLDPAYPEERLAFMLEDSQAKVLLTQRAFDDGRWTIDDGAQSETEIVYGLSSIVYLDADWPRIARQPAHAPDVPVLPEHLAYVIYTSGSTGTPKGVMVQHDTLVSFCTMAGEEYRLAPGDRGLQFTSISWDTSVEEIFPCLAYGAALVLRPPSMLDSMASFVGACQALGISVLNLPTAVWHVLAASFEQEQPIFPDTIRLVIIGGERVQPEQLAKWWRYVSPSVQLLNTYGLAEATVEVTRCDLSCDPEEWGAGREIPIGRPFPGVQIYVLDRRFEPALIGVAGELYVGGTNLSRGYLNRPDLTAERFVPNPFGTVNDEDRTMKSPDSSFIVHRSSFGERLYKTGDVARYRPDGQLEFVGRSDDQVKIRGYRVELGEIETVLNQHPAVREVVVLAREEIRPSGGYSDKRLVAYVVPSNDQRPTTNDQRSSLEDRRLKIEDSNGDASGSRSSILYPLSSELRSFLQERLPDYMLPSAVVLLDALPLTPNGKVDSRALPAPDWATAEKGVEFVAPRTPIEQQVALIWAQVLGVAQVGVHDNFFALGGHSLLATQALARIRDVFEIELPLSNLFETPTVAGLAASIETILWAVQGEETALPPDGLEEEGEL